MTTTDKEATPRNSYLSPARIKQIGQRMYGSGWQKKLGQELGLSTSTIFRYAQGCEPVPYSTALLLSLIVDRLDSGKAVKTIKVAGTIQHRAFTPAAKIRAAA